MDKFETVCPGCGVKILTGNRDKDNDLNASSACRALCYELYYYTLSLHDSYFIHQLVVDTYAAQHFPGDGKPIMITFALVGLYLVNEKNFTGKEVQNAHLKLAGKGKVWPEFKIPADKNWLTVSDVFNVPDGKKQEMIKKWSKSVWNIWLPEKEKIQKFLSPFYA